MGVYWAKTLHPRPQLNSSALVRKFQPPAPAPTPLALGVKRKTFELRERKTLNRQRGVFFSLFFCFTHRVCSRERPRKAPSATKLTWLLPMWSWSSSLRPAKLDSSSLVRWLELRSLKRRKKRGMLGQGREKGCQPKPQCLSPHPFSSF